MVRSSEKGLVQLSIEKQEDLDKVCKPSQLEYPVFCD